MLPNQCSTTVLRGVATAAGRRHWLTQRCCCASPRAGGCAHTAASVPLTQPAPGALCNYAPSPVCWDGLGVGRRREVGAGDGGAYWRQGTPAAQEGSDAEGARAGCAARRRRRARTPRRPACGCALRRAAAWVWPLSLGMHDRNARQDAALRVGRATSCCCCCCVAGCAGQLDDVDANGAQLLAHVRAQLRGRARLSAAGGGKATARRGRSALVVRASIVQSKTPYNTCIVYLALPIFGR
jgi:hypothetical protein